MPTIQNRRATAAQWTAANPVLAAGELGFELDTNSAKIGDGLTPWKTLPYLSDESLSELVETGRLSEAELNTTYGTEVMEETITEVAKSPTGIVARRGGKTKTDGQNIENLRRPTLVVDRMFPNARVDHTILWVDETIGRMYTLGKDTSIRIQTWDPATVNVNFGTVGPTRNRPAVGKELAPHGCFFRTASGALLMEEYTRADQTTRILRCADSNAVTWTEVLPMRGDAIPLGPQSISQDPVTGYLYFAEYSSVALSTIRIYRSTDDGVTWQVWVERPKSSTTPGTFRHFHSTRWDPVSQRVYFTVGDGNDVAGLYRVNADGSDIEPVVTNADISDQFGLQAPARAVDVMFFPTHIAWACDGSGGQNHVYRIARSSIGTGTPEVEQVAAIDNTGWYSQRASDDGSVWVCSASAERSGPSANADKDASHLYVVSDNASKVDEVSTTAMNGAFGAGSLTAVPGPPGGDTFWLRSHGYAMPPYSMNSGFQMRCRISNGVVPLQAPVDVRPPVYVAESRNWEGPLAASQTKVIAHTRAGRTRLLRILEVGVKVIDGPIRTVELQVFNVSKGTVVHTHNKLHQSWRSDYYGESAEYAWEYLVPEADELVFRLVQTTGEAVASVSAHITFGWAPYALNG